MSENKENNSGQGEFFESFENFDNNQNNENTDVNNVPLQDAAKDEFEDISSNTTSDDISTQENEFADVGFDISFDEKIEDIMSDTSMVGGKREYEDISSSSESAKGGRKKMSKGKKALLISGISLLSIILVVAILASYFLGVRYKYEHDKKFSVTVEPIDENVINIALFGVDTRGGANNFSGNTDSIMILSINKKTNKIKIISIMRDTFVPIIDESDQSGTKVKKHGKVNAAYASGGSDITKAAECAVMTLNSAYGLDISNYAVINFAGMVEIIDAVGGITANITSDEITWKGHDKPNLNGCMEEICREKGRNVDDYYIKKSGEQQLNGVQAVAYARIRHCKSIWGTNNDYGRTDRQRYVMEQLFNKATKISKDKYDGLIRSLIPCSRTSLGVNDILDLALSVLLKNPTFEQYRLPQEMEISVQRYSPMYNRFGAVLYYDLDYAKKLIKGVIYEDLTMEDAVKKYPVEKNKWYTGSDSGTVATADSIPPDAEDAPDIDDTTPDDGTTITPPDGGTEIPPEDGETPPDDGTETPPDGDDTPPEDGETPPDDGTEVPDDGETPPDEDGTETPPDESVENPSDDDTQVEVISRRR